MWVEHIGDTNHQVHIQHARSICIACIAGYQCYPKAWNNLCTPIKTPMMPLTATVTKQCSWTPLLHCEH